MLEYLTCSQRNSITDEQGEEMRNILWHMSDLEYRILDISEDGDSAYVTSELILFGFSYEGRFVLVKEHDKWLIDDMHFADESSMINGNRTDG